MKTLKHILTASALILVPYLASAKGNNGNCQCQCQDGQGNKQGWSQRGPGQGNRGQQGPGQKGHGMRMFQQTLSQLELTEGQQIQIDETLTTFRESAKNLRTEMQAARGILQDLRDNNAQDTEEYVEALLLVDSFQQAGFARRRLIRESVMEILTEDQRLELIDLMEQSMPRGKRKR